VNDRDAKMHVLVTGGAGYIGSTLVPVLLSAGHDVTVLDRFYFGEQSLAAPLRQYGARLRLVRQDVRTVSGTVLAGVDAIVDLAGISNDPACELDERLTRSVNLDASARLVELAASRGVRRVVFASSCSVYGHGEATALTEASPLNPVSLYARCKAEAEQRLFELGGAIEVCALRLATVFGLSPRMRFDLAVNVMAKNAYVNRSITVEGGGRQWRPFVHVGDVAQAMRLALEAPAALVAGEVFNVGANENNLRIVTLAYRIRDAMPTTEIHVVSTDPDRRDYHVRFDKIRERLDFVPRHGIEDGIREVVAAIRDGDVDPLDRRCYTLQQYLFLRDVERTYRSLALEGQVLMQATG
jgi:nucleoside-diphosphate-sugar epimerase